LRKAAVFYHHLAQGMDARERKSPKSRSETSSHRTCLTIKSVSGRQHTSADIETDSNFIQPQPHPLDYTPSIPSDSIPYVPKAKPNARGASLVFSPGCINFSSSPFSPNSQTTHFLSPHSFSNHFNPSNLHHIITPNSPASTLARGLSLPIFQILPKPHIFPNSFSFSNPPFPFQSSPPNPTISSRNPPPVLVILSIF
jgi:hypothetical protein